MHIHRVRVVPHLGAVALCAMPALAVAQGGAAGPPPTATASQAVISVSYHSWWLANRADALYGANGAVVARVAGRVASSHVGHEIDVQASRALTPYLALVGGYAHVLPGAFLKQATPGATFRAPYVMATYTVLADK